MNKKNNRKGFTIVELVIVIAVIAILAAVLIPTFGNVIEKANISAAKQEAKNVFTNYVTVTAETGAYVDDGFVLTSKGYYVELEDGGVKGEPTKTAPTVCYYLIDDTSATLTAVNTCDHSDCANPQNNQNP
ncbi:MAG: prepilin-type N-terminal cleavage/methylation domain-containing protein [Clostridia bacterium]|nr:prepilin-type N-terminal cleavage/methylation domain-containing protein [Clostridia bacterium]